jgi:sugar phosphate isomerase/epimerase
MRSAPFLEYVDACQKGGFAGITFSLDLYARAREGYGFSDADLRGVLADHGLAVDYVDGLAHWLPDSPAVTTFGSGAIRFPYKNMAYFGVAEALGADLVNVVALYPDPVDVEVAAEALARVADEAAEHGCRVCLEFTPVGGVADAGTAWEIVRMSGRSNAGVLFDSWHYGRGPSTPEQLLAIPADRYFALQISDTKPVAEKDMVHETLHGRLLPGAGAASVAELLALLDDHGVRLPFGAEVFSDEVAALGLVGASKAIAGALRQVIPARAQAETGRP